MSAITASKQFVKRILPKSLLGTLGYWLNRGTTTYSQFGEDIWLNRLLDGKQGFYVDIGSFHPKFASNTYRLHRRGWRGINIDVDQYKIRMFDRFRKRDTNLTMGVSSQTTTLPFYFKPGHTYGSESSFNRDLIEQRSGAADTELGVRQVPVTTLNEILSRHLPVQSDGSSVPIDLINIDVEGHEHEILANFDFNRYRPRCLCIEIHAESLDELQANETLQLIASKGYRLHAWPAPSCIFMRSDVVAAARSEAQAA